jgi:hypothetical protein
MKRLVLLFILLAPALGVIAQKKKAKKVTVAIADSLYNAGNWKGAVESYTVLLKEPEAAKVAASWLNLGVSQLNLNAYDKALQAFGKTQKLNPASTTVLLYRARTLSASGHIDRSIEVLDSAMLAGFGNFKLVDRENYFANLRNDKRWLEVRGRLVERSKPCMSIPKAREFDFWLGEWEVYLTSNLNARAGTNKITLSSSGCVIEENWEAFNGPHQGMSMNYFDPADSTWNQKWAGSGQDIQEFYDGVYKDGTMQFKFDTTSPTGARIDGKLTFTNISPDRVRQHAQQSVDGGKTWTDVYDFTYIRREGTEPIHP